MAATAQQATEITPRGNLPRLTVGWLGGIILIVIALPCLLTLPWSLDQYDVMSETRMASPTWSEPMGTDLHGRSMLWRCLTGGAISLGVGLCAATISVVIGVTWGAVAGLAGGRVDAIMMRFVDILYGLPYILLVVLVKIALQPAVQSILGGAMDKRAAESVASIITLLLAIGGVSWLTMARVIRGQVLSLRSQPFIEAARACGFGPLRILRVHLLPNLVGPIVVYTTLTVPTAILQESFLSFLAIGVQPPLPSWGNLASDGVRELHALALKGSTFKWWLAFWPCALLGLTLLALNFLGDALRNRLDPRRLKT